MKRSKLRFLAALVAMMFMLVASPEAMADDEIYADCFACGDCHPDLWCTGCGIYAMYAISGCCGMGSGTTYCMQAWGGFAVGCSSGERACQCNTTGESCSTIS